MHTKTILIIALSLPFSAGIFAQNQSTMKNINQNAPVRCSKTIMINASREKVWEVITNIDQWAEWQTDINYARLNGDLNAGTTFDWKTGGAKIHSTIHTVSAPKYFGWTGKAMGLFAIHNWSLIESGEQTVVSVDESMEGFLAALFKKPFRKSLEKGMQNWLALLKIKCESPIVIE